MIVYFSATGNSRYCAQLLAHCLQDQCTDAFSWIREGDCVLFKGSNSMGLGAAAADLLARLQQSGKKA